MKIDIQYLAKLASLYVSDEEASRLEVQMARITDMASDLPEFDAGVFQAEPMCLREDAVVESYDRNELLKNAPQTENGCFVVPKVIE